MKFLIVGPGAMGCLFAARLNQAGYDAELLDYRSERADMINKEGIRIEGVSGEYGVQVPVFTGELPEKPDIALFCVKANKTGAVAKSVKMLIGDAVSVLTLQNGVGNVEALVEIFGEDRVFGGVTSEGSTLLGPGHARHAGKGETFIGGGSSEELAADIAEAFNKAGFNTRTVKDVTGLIWGKLIVNVGINALTAITGLKNGRIAEIKGTRDVMEKAVEEAVSVASAKGITLPYSDPILRVEEVCRATADNIASMLQDVLNRRPTEIEAINGAIVREGTEHRIPTPVNHILTCLIQAIEGTYDQRVGT